MAKIFKAVAAVGLIVAGVVTMNPTLIFQGASIGASLLFKPKATALGDSNLDRLNLSINPQASRVMVFGRTAMGTDLMDQEITGTDKEFLHRFVVCAGHKVNAIEQVWFDDELAWTSAGGVQGRFVDYLQVTPKLEGTPANAVNLGARMGASRRYTGCAYIYFRFRLTGLTKKTESPFASQVPTRITIIGEGVPCYDPRQDSTRGGSGTMRADDQTTWTYGTHARNLACQLATRMLGWRIQNPQSGTWKLSVGMGVPPDRIDWASFIEGANLCDEAVALAGGGTEPRYRGDGVFTEDDDPTEVADAFKAAMNADLDDQDGLFRLTVFHNDLALPVAHFTEADIQGDYAWLQTPDLNTGFNVVRGSWIDPSDRSLYQPAPYPEVRVASPDGLDRVHPASFGLVQRLSQAQRLAKQRLQRQLYGGTFRATFLATGWRVQKNSVITLTFAPEGFVTKLFRVVETEVRQDGLVPILLREENAAIYAWDAEESAAVTLAEPTLYAAGDSPIEQMLLTVEEGANVTEDHISAGIIGQSAWATYGTLPPSRLEGLTNGQDVYIYKRSLTTPALPSASATITFATAAVTGLTNGWTTSIPASDGNPLWISRAPAIGTGTTTTILSTAWDAPRAMADDKIRTFYEAGDLAPTLVLAFAGETALDSRVTFTRASSATRVNASGFIETLASDLPRFDYDPVTLAAKGLLIEESRINVMPYSEDAATSLTAEATSFSSNTQVAPTNSATGDTMTASASSARHIGYRSFVGTAETYAFSQFLKQDTARFAQMNMASSGIRYGVILDLQTGLVTNTESTGSPSGTGYRVEAFKDGWYRLSITMTLIATTCYAVTSISDSATPTYDASGCPTFNAAGTEAIHLWGSQLEVGVFASSYIPNLVGGSTTRAADVASVTGANFSDWYNQSEGTFLSVADGRCGATGVAFVGQVTDAGATSNIDVGRYQSTLRAEFVTSGVQQASLVTGGAADGTTRSLAIAYSVNSFGASEGGATALTDLSGTVPTTLDRMYLGSDGYTVRSLNGHIALIKYWNTRRGNGKLALISAASYIGGPAPSAIGDVWYNTAEGNKQYRASSISPVIWDAVQDTAISTAQLTADGKNKIFSASASAPTGAIAGDLWPDSSSSPIVVRRFDGVSTWSIIGTVGAQAGANIFRTDGVTVMSQADIRTLEGIASAITGQGALATQNSATWASQVSGSGKPADNADVTAANTAAAISGQGALATLNTVGATQVNSNAITAPYQVSVGVVTLSASSGFYQTITGLSFSATITTGEDLDVDLNLFLLWAGADGTRFNVDAILLRDGVTVASFGTVMDTNDMATNNQGGFAIPANLSCRVAGNSTSSTYSVQVQLSSSVSESNSGGSKTFSAPLDIRVRQGVLRGRRYSR